MNTVEAIEAMIMLVYLSACQWQNSRTRNWIFPCLWVLLKFKLCVLRMSLKNPLSLSLSLPRSLWFFYKGRNVILAFMDRKCLLWVMQRFYAGHLESEEVVVVIRIRIIPFVQCFLQFGWQRGQVAEIIPFVQLGWLQ